mgnify:CR=1 FL=1
MTILSKKERHTYKPSRKLDGSLLKMIIGVEWLRPDPFNLREQEWAFYEWALFNSMMKLKFVKFLVLIRLTWYNIMELFIKNDNWCGVA